MSPRKYEMRKRRDDAVRTRRQIVEATVQLHAEQGIHGTSWRDIAERADVAVTTVYNHFPTLDDLVPACGRQILETAMPPDPAAADRYTKGTRGRRARLEAVLGAIVDFYLRAWPNLDMGPADRALPAVVAFEDDLRARVRALLVHALGVGEDAALDAATGLAGFPAVRSLRESGVPEADLPRVIATAVLAVAGTAKRKEP